MNTKGFCLSSKKNNKPRKISNVMRTRNSKNIGNKALTDYQTNHQIKKPKDSKTLLQANLKNENIFLKKLNIKRPISTIQKRKGLENIWLPSSLLSNNNTLTGIGKFL